MEAFWRTSVLLLVMAVLSISAAPTSYEASSHDLQTQDSYPEPKGCYYNFEHYEEGDRIVTNEPCLNCTCHNHMLMCYLRVCPFTKAIGQDCTVEKRPDQCCPVITCPQVPVQLLTSSTTQPTTTTTALGRPDSYGCMLENNVFYPDGAQVPSDTKKPCELCYCIRNHTACVMQECTLNVEGCRPVYQEGVCCPVRYDCDYEDALTTPRPTPGLVTTPGGPTDCQHEGEIYHDGEMVTLSEKEPCQHCYCMRGDIVCAVQDCGTPLEGVDCKPNPPQPGHCCPSTFQCVNGTVPVDSVKEPSNKQTEKPTFDPHDINEVQTTEKEVSSEEENVKEETSSTEDGQDYVEEHTEKAHGESVNHPESEHHETTAEVDLSASHHHLTEAEQHSKETFTTTYEGSVQESSTTVASHVENEPVSEPEVNLNEDRDEHVTIGNEENSLSHHHEHSSSSSEPVPETYTEISVQNVEMHTSAPEYSGSSNKVQKEDDVQETESPQTSTLVPNVVSHFGENTNIPHNDNNISLEHDRRDPIEENGEEKVTKPEQVNEQTSDNVNEISEISTGGEVTTSPSPSIPHQGTPDLGVPGEIPGEGSCLVDGQTYPSGSQIPTSNICQSGCLCINSIVHCKLIECTPPPGDYRHCMPVERADSCCPEYICDDHPQDSLESHSQVLEQDHVGTSHQHISHDDLGEQQEDEHQEHITPKPENSESIHNEMIKENDEHDPIVNDNNIIHHSSSPEIQNENTLSATISPESQINEVIGGTEIEESSGDGSGNVNSYVETTHIGETDSFYTTSKRPDDHDTAVQEGLEHNTDTLDYSTEKSQSTEEVNDNVYNEISSHDHILQETSQTEINNDHQHSSVTEIAHIENTVNQQTTKESNVPSEQSHEENIDNTTEKENIPDKNEESTVSISSQHEGEEESIMTTIKPVFSDSSHGSSDDLDLENHSELLHNENNILTSEKGEATEVTTQGIIATNIDNEHQGSIKPSQSFDETHITDIQGTESSMSSQSEKEETSDKIDYSAETEHPEHISLQDSQDHTGESSTTFSDDIVEDQKVSLETNVHDEIIHSTDNEEQKPGGLISANQVREPTTEGNFESHHIIHSTLPSETVTSSVEENVSPTELPSIVHYLTEKTNLATVGENEAAQTDEKSHEHETSKEPEVKHPENTEAGITIIQTTASDSLDEQVKGESNEISAQSEVTTGAPVFPETTHNEAHEIIPKGDEYVTTEKENEKADDNTSHQHSIVHESLGTHAEESITEQFPTVHSLPSLMGSETHDIDNGTQVSEIHEATDKIETDVPAQTLVTHDGSERLDETIPDNVNEISHDETPNSDQYITDSPDTPFSTTNQPHSLPESTEKVDMPLDSTNQPHSSSESTVKFDTTHDLTTEPHPSPESIDVSHTSADSTLDIQTSYEHLEENYPSHGSTHSSHGSSALGDQSPTPPNLTDEVHTDEPTNEESPSHEKYPDHIENQFTSSEEITSVNDVTNQPTGGSEGDDSALEFEHHSNTQEYHTSTEKGITNEESSITSTERLEISSSSSEHEESSQHGDKIPSRLDDPVYTPEGVEEHTPYPSDEEPDDNEDEKEAPTEHDIGTESGGTDHPDVIKEITTTPSETDEVTHDKHSSDHESVQEDKEEEISTSFGEEHTRPGIHHTLEEVIGVTISESQTDATSVPTHTVQDEHITVTAAPEEGLKEQNQDPHIHNQGTTVESHDHNLQDGNVLNEEDGMVIETVTLVPEGLAGLTILDHHTESSPSHKESTSEHPIISHSESGLVTSGQEAPDTVNEHPETPDTVNEHPETPDTVNEHPETPDTVNEHPETLDTVNEHPETPDTVNEHPETPDTVNEHPEAADTVNEHPETPDTVNEHPETPNTVNEHPETPDSVNEHPETPNTVHEHPETPDRVNEHPETPSQEEIVHEVLNEIGNIHDQSESEVESAESIQEADNKNHQPETTMLPTQNHEYEETINESDNNDQHEGFDEHEQTQSTEDSEKQNDEKEVEGHILQVNVHQEPHEDITVHPMVISSEHVEETTSVEGSPSSATESSEGHSTTNQHVFDHIADAEDENKETQEIQVTEQAASSQGSTDEYHQQPVTENPQQQENVKDENVDHIAPASGGESDVDKTEKDESITPHLVKEDDTSTENTKVGSDLSPEIEDKTTEQAHFVTNSPIEHFASASDTHSEEHEPESIEDHSDKVIAESGDHTSNEEAVPDQEEGQHSPEEMENEKETDHEVNVSEKQPDSSDNKQTQHQDDDNLEQHPDLVSGDHGQIHTSSEIPEQPIEIESSENEKPQQVVGNGSEEEQPQQVVGNGYEEEQPQQVVGNGSEEEQPQQVVDNGPEEEQPQQVVDNGPEEEQPQQVAGNGSEEEQPQQVVNNGSEEEQPQQVVDNDSDKEQPQQVVDNGSEEEQPQQVVENGSEEKPVTDQSHEVNVDISENQPESPITFTEEHTIKDDSESRPVDNEHQQITIHESPENPELLAGSSAQESHDHGGPISSSEHKVEPIDGSGDEKVLLPNEEQITNGPLVSITDSTTDQMHIHSEDSENTEHLQEPISNIYDTQTQKTQEDVSSQPESISEESEVIGLTQQHVVGTESTVIEDKIPVTTEGENANKVHSSAPPIDKHESVTYPIDHTSIKPTEDSSQMYEYSTQHTEGQKTGNENVMHEEKYEYQSTETASQYSPSEADSYITTSSPAYEIISKEPEGADENIHKVDESTTAKQPFEPVTDEYNFHQESSETLSSTHPQGLSHSSHYPYSTEPSTSPHQPHYTEKPSYAHHGQTHLGSPLFPSWAPKPQDHNKIPAEVSQVPEDFQYPTGPEQDYDDDESGHYGPGTCRYGGKVYLSAQQIPRDDPCDFCFCFRSDIICLQQSCPPPIQGCYQEKIHGFCCPRYECHVSMATMVNLTTTTTTTTTTLPPHFFPHNYKGAVYRSGCQVRGVAYRVGDSIPSISGPCLNCRCGANGQMKCDPTECGPQAALLKQVMDAAAVSRR